MHSLSGSFSWLLSYSLQLSQYHCCAKLRRKNTLNIRDCNKAKITVSTQQERTGKSSHYLPLPVSEGMTL